MAHTNSTRNLSRTSSAFASQSERSHLQLDRGLSRHGTQRSVVAGSSAPSQTTVEALPAVLRVPLQFLLLDWVDADDDFTQILRKIVVTAGLCMFVHPVSYIGYFGWLIAQGAPIGGPVALIVACLFSMLSWSAIYFVCRALGAVPDVILDLWLVGTNVAFSLLIASMPEYPATTCVFGSAILTILCVSPRRGLFLGWCALMYIVEQYNNSMDGTGYELLVPGERRGPDAERLINHMSGFFIAATVLAALLMQTREHVHHVTDARNAVALAQKIARQLACYDTVAVQELLDEQLGNGDAGGNAALFEAFANIADNLEQFRPHLPNWMLDQVKAAAEQMAKDDEDPDLASIGSFAVSEVLHTARSEADLKHHRSGSLGGHRGVSSADFSNGGGSRGHGSGEHAASSGSLGVPLASSAQMRRGRSRNPSPGDSPGTAALIGRNANLAMAAQPADIGYQGKVSVATLCVGPRHDGCRVSSEYVAAIDAVVSEAFATASATHAAVHAFLGDKLTLTWNATHRVVQPDIKACRFIAQLRKKIAASPHADTVAIGGAIVTSDAVCRFAGRSGGQRTLQLSTSEAWMAVHHALTVFGCKMNSVVVDGWTARNARQEVNARDVEAIRVSWDDGCGASSKCSDLDDDNAGNEVPAPRGLAANTANTPAFERPPPVRATSNYAVAAESAMNYRVVVASEILDERNDKHDEWMYVLDAQSKADDADGVVSLALRHALAGEFEQAAAELARLSEGDGLSASTKAVPGSAAALESPLVLRLIDRVHDFVQRKAGARAADDFPVVFRHPTAAFAWRKSEQQERQQ